MHYNIQLGILFVWRYEHDLFQNFKKSIYRSQIIRILISSFIDLASRKSTITNNASVGSLTAAPILLGELLEARDESSFSVF